MLQGCVQRVATPATNDALLDLLEAQGREVVYAQQEGCCGGLDLHLGAATDALARIRANIDGLWPHLEGVEAVVSTASGCGVTYKDYARLLQDDPEYGPKAAALLRKLRDVGEFVLGESLRLAKREDIETVAWHAPCTLQHGQRVSGVVERILESVGYRLVPVVDAHLCCGSAGSYSILQPQLSDQLRTNKLANLQRARPDVIATANVGCQTHLDGASQVPVVHWLELLRSG